MAHKTRSGLPDSGVFDIVSRASLARHWRQKREGITAYLEDGGDFADLGDRGMREFSYMKKFEAHVRDILGVIADRVTPTTLEDLLEYGLRDERPETRESKRPRSYWPGAMLFTG